LKIERFDEKANSEQSEGAKSTGPKIGIARLPNQAQAFDHQAYSQFGIGFFIIRPEKGKNMKNFLMNKES
jgi:hypothetical protein